MEANLVNVLLVDDDNVDIVSVQRAFKKNNIANPLFVANDGVDALDMLRGTNGKQKIDPTPRIIITDINMPRMNGHELMKELRADKDFMDVSIFVLTTSGLEKDREDAAKYNIAGYLIKPIEMKSFIETVTALNNYSLAVTNDSGEGQGAAKQQVIFNGSVANG